MNPVIANYITKHLPLPNLPNNNFVSSPIEVDREDQGIARVDHHLGPKDIVYGSYIIDDLSQNFPFQIVNGASAGGNVPIGSGFDTPIRTQLGSITWLHTFSPTVVNEFIFAANRSATLQDVPHDTTPPSALGFTNVSPDDPAGTAPPVITTLSFNLGPNPGGPSKLHDATFHWQDSLSVNRGHHNLKFGVDIRRVRNNFDFDFENNGLFDFGTNQNFTGDPFADLVGGFFDNYSQFSRAIYGIRTTSWHFYGQDSWKILKRLTLSYGLRHEYNTPMQDPHNEIIGFFPGQQSTKFPGAPRGVLYPGDPGTPNRGLTFPDRNNFAPRFGFAWDMMGNARLVMRGGFGIFYDIEDGALNLQFGGQAPFGRVTNITPAPADYTSVTPGFETVGDPFTPFGQTNPYPTGSRVYFGVPVISLAWVVEPHFRTPNSENANFGFS